MVSSPRPVLRAASLCSLALLVTGCGKILGVDDYRVAPPGCGSNTGGACGATVHPTAGAGPSSEAGSGENACGLPYGTTTCASCVHENCCTEATECARSPVCNDYEKCLGACPQGDPACRAQCGIDHPVGTASEVSTLSACLVTHCENQCGLSCGALAGWAVESEKASAFQKCMASNSCDQVRACASSADCDAVTRCFAACSANDCIDTCMDAHGVNPAWWFPDAGDAGSTTSTFVGFARARTACATAAGGYWECVGNVSWPAVEGAVTTLETVVANAISPGTQAGMDVWACATNDVPCNNPWGHDQTDAQGRISLTIRRLPGADATGYLKVTSSTTVPTYFYWGFPLTHARYVEGPGRSGIGTSGVSFITSMANQSLSALDGGSSNRATVLVFVEDCLASAAAGVGVTLTPADPGIVVLDLQLQQTDPITPASGVLVFLNVPAGRVKVTATPAAIGKPSGEVGIYVRAGSFTSVLLRPTPM